MGLLTVAEAAAVLGVNARRIRQLCQQGRIEGAAKHGWAWFIPEPVKVREGQRGPKSRLARDNESQKMTTFLSGLDKDLRERLILQIRNLWTHSSTAIEGNTLTLGETEFVLSEGLTISGKPLKDHQEVVGHARAIDLIYQLVREDRRVTESDLFALHQAVQTGMVIDVYSPIGAWKKDTNGVYAVTTDGRREFMPYADPADVPGLMSDWLILCNRLIQRPLEKKDAVKAYAHLHVSFVRVHPFFDGNGRIARLISNLPVLKSGLPPILIPVQERQRYVRVLADYELTVGQARSGAPLLPAPETLSEFETFCRDAWEPSWTLVGQARSEQRRRLQERQKSGEADPVLPPPKDPGSR